MITITEILEEIERRKAELWRKQDEADAAQNSLLATCHYARRVEIELLEDFIKRQENTNAMAD